MLLLRIHNELKMQLSANYSLYQGFIVFATKKQVEAENVMNALKGKLNNKLIAIKVMENSKISDPYLQQALKSIF